MLHYMSHIGSNMEYPVPKKLSGLENLLPEVDYQALMAQMPHQSHPRRKLKELQNKGLLIRLKKGFYVLTKEMVGQDHSEQIVSNLLYGPSYLSLEYALAFYHLIPERVEVMTSITTQKNKIFPTMIGKFTYEHLSQSLYPIGVRIGKTPDQRCFLIATPEKALMDIFSLRFKKTKKPTEKMIRSALTEDLRFDLAAFIKNKDQSLLTEMKFIYKNRPWHHLLIDFLLEAK